MLSLSARPILAAFLLPKPKPKPRRLLLLLRHLHSSSSASALTPPTPRTTTPDLPEDADPTPLFLRPPAHPSRMPRSPPSASGPRRSSRPPRRTSTATSAGSSRTPPPRPVQRRPGGAPPPPPPRAARRARGLWLRHVQDRRPFQYVVGNEHWKDLVVAVRDGVLIPRPETEAVVDMVGAVEGSGRVVGGPRDRQRHRRGRGQDAGARGEGVRHRRQRGRC
ncbi:hypothetical protein ZWY2020_029829 [Hordeum vulgare]|nr:hypothetical protein ZWY2020_029829 [Hordeum vulgare]